MLKRLLILMLIPLLCSCTKNHQEVLTFSSWGSVTETKIIDNVITRFENENPEIKISFIHIPQNYFQKLHLLFASNTEPDVVFINNLYLPLYAGRLEDLTDFDTKEYYKQGLDALTVNGKLLAIPRDISNFVFYYNKNLVRENLNSDWTFSDFERILNNIKNNENISSRTSKSPHPYPPQPGRENAVTELYEVYSSGRGVVHGTVPKNEKYYGVSFERDVFLAEPYIMTLGFDNGIKFYQGLEGVYAPTPAQVGSSTLAQMFIDGKLAFYLSGRWMYPKIKETAKFPFEIVVFPGFTPADASGWAISKNSKHKVAARKFVEYLSSNENIEYIASTGLIVPARKDAKFDNNEVFLEAIKKSKPHIVDKNYSKQRDKLNKELFK